MARPWLDVFNIIRLIPKEQIQGRQRREEKNRRNTLRKHEDIYLSVDLNLVYSLGIGDVEQSEVEIQ